MFRVAMLALIVAVSAQRQGPVDGQPNPDTHVNPKVSVLPQLPLERPAGPPSTLPPSDQPPVVSEQAPAQPPLASGLPQEPRGAPLKRLAGGRPTVSILPPEAVSELPLEPPLRQPLPSGPPREPHGPQRRGLRGNRRTADRPGRDAPPQQSEEPRGPPPRPGFLQSSKPWDALPFPLFPGDHSDSNAKPLGPPPQFSGEPGDRPFPGDDASPRTDGFAFGGRAPPRGPPPGEDAVSPADDGFIFAGQAPPLAPPHDEDDVSPPIRI